MSSTQRKFEWFTALFIAAVVTASVSCAPWHGGPVRPVPLPRAADACTDLPADEACSLTDQRNNEMNDS